MSPVDEKLAPSTSITPTYSVHIKKVGDDEVESDPFTHANVGDTVRYYTRAVGEVLIEFPGPSPFRQDDKKGTSVPGDVILTVVSESVGRGLPNDAFETHCFIMMPNEKNKTLTRKIGWAPHYPKAGSNLHVPRP